MSRMPATSKQTLVMQEQRRLIERELKARRRARKLRATRKR